MNACVIFSAESERRINAYRAGGTQSLFATIEISDRIGDIDRELVLDPTDARMLGETLIAIAKQIEGDTE